MWSYLYIVITKQRKSINLQKDKRRDQMTNSIKIKKSMALINKIYSYLNHK